MWYVVQTVSGREETMLQLCENIIESGLIKQSRIVKSEKKIKKKGTWETSRLNLFPGYIFVETESVSNLYEEFKLVPGMTKLLGVGKEIVRLTQEEEEFLFGLLDEAFTVRMSEGILDGDKVHILKGPLKGYEGYIKKIDRRNRKAILEVDFFNRKTVMTIGLEIIQKIEKAENEHE